MSEFIMRLEAHDLFMLFQGNYAMAGTHLSHCLRALGRPLPTSKFDVCSSLFWQFLRQCLHRVWIGRWLADRAGLWYRATNDDVKNSAKDAALVYHKIHQLHLTGEQAYTATSSVYKSIAELIQLS